MLKSVSALLALAVMACCALARAATVASVIEVAQPAWIELDDLVSELDRSNDIGIGDLVRTGDNGRAEIQLWSGMILRLYPNSRILLRTAAPPADGQGENAAELLLQAGSLCLRPDEATGVGRNFRLSVDDRLRAVIHQSAHICVNRREGFTALVLHDGSVELNNEIEPALLVLSEAGIEFQLDDDGAFRLLPPGSGEVRIGLEDQVFIADRPAVSTDSESDSASAPANGAVEDDPAPAAAAEETAAQTGIGPRDQAAPYVYTVYLFSTRSEEVANEVHEKLRRAGHDARIIVRETETPTRFRIAVSGFASRDDARAYSDSVVGRFGIRDTWIGRDRAESATQDSAD